MLTEAERRLLITFQRDEITSTYIYRALARREKTAHNREVLKEIAADELRHYQAFRAYSEQNVRPNRFKVWFFLLMSRILGFTFAVKLAERGEEQAQIAYDALSRAVPEAKDIALDEARHEATLIDMLDEERLRYTGSIVLGLNDALVELTGSLAGLTLALQNTRLIAMTGAITGIAAALSMATSEYLSTKSEDTTKEPLKAALYTGAAYIIAVVVLIVPYLLLDNFYVCLACTLAAAILIIAFFNYYISVAKDIPFRRRFLEMAGLSLGVAALSFAIGYALRAVFGIEV